MYKNKNILIVGAGIHGCFLAKYLSDYDLNIHVIEKNKDICLGSSNATHNRANRGFHYPRSKETTSECKVAYKYFEDNYNSFLKKFQSYYCIEKKSKTSFKKYINFFKINNLKFEIIDNSKYLKKDNLEGIIKAEEGCYNHSKIKTMLKKKMSNNVFKSLKKFKLFLFKYIDRKSIFLKFLKKSRSPESGLAEVITIFRLLSNKDFMRLPLNEDNVLADDPKIIACCFFCTV